MEFKTAKEYFHQIGKFAEENKNTLYNLKCRWLDEKEYEDFEEYKKVIESRLAEYDLKFSSISKAFTMKFLYEKTHLVEVKVPINGNIQISLKSLP